MTELTHARSAEADKTIEPYGHPPRLLLFLLCSAAFSSSWTGFRVSGLNLADLFLILALSYSLIIGILGRVRLPVAWPFLVLPTVVLLLMGRDALFFDRLPFQTLSAAQYTTGESLGETVGGSATFLIRLILCWTAVGLALGVFQRSPRDLVRVAVSWVAGTAISAIWAAGQTTLALPDLPFIYHIESATRAVGLANHPNSFAETIVTVVPLAVHFAFGPRAGVVRRAVGAAFVGLVIWALFLSGSRAGLAVGIVALVLSVVIRLVWSGRGVWGIPLALLAIVGAVLWLPRIWSTTRFSQGAGQLSDNERIHALTQGFELFARHPLGGAGLSTWLGEMVPLILLSGGGLILFFTFYASIGSVLIRALSGRNDELVMQLLAATILVLIFGLLNNGLVERYLYWALILAYHLTAGPGTPQRREVHSRQL